MAGIHLKISVPEFPEFKTGDAWSSDVRYSVYLNKFMTYAQTSIAAQVKVAVRAMESGGFESQKVEIKHMVEDVRLSMDALAEKAALCVAAEVQDVVRAVDGMSKVVSEAVVEKGSSDGLVVGSVDAGGAVSAKTLQNREKRRLARLRKVRKQGKVCAGGESGSCSVPVWRRGASVEPSPVSARGFFTELDSSVQRELRETRAKLLIEKNKRELVEEQRKLNYLNSPMAAVSEAMRAMAVVERIAEKEKDSKVLGWAKTVSEGYASSFSGIGSPAVGSLATVSVDSSNSQKFGKIVKEWGLKVREASDAERYCLAQGIVATEELVVARSRVGRVLNSTDFLRKDAPFSLTPEQRWFVERSESD